MIVGKDYKQKEYNWVITILLIGKNRAFVLRHQDNYECSYSLDFLNEEFIEV